MIKNIFKVLILCVLCALIGAWNVFGASRSASAESRTGEAVLEISTGRILHEKGGSVPMPMASTTKIMTALVVLEHCALDEVVTVPKIATLAEGSSIYLRQGDKRTVEELLYGLMLRSGNDAALSLAIHAGGSVESFATIMNERAREIGATNTNFTNPHGLHDDDHYTTAIDLAKISCVAMQNDVFKKIVGTKSVKFNDRVYYNKNKMLSSYEGATGIKTGFTKRAGRCLVSSSTRNGMDVVCVVLNCYNMWNRSKALMTTAHESYAMTDLLEDFTGADVAVTGGTEETTRTMHKNPRLYPLKRDGSESIKYSTILPEFIKAPINSGVNVGKIDIYVDNRLIFSENLYTINHVKKKSILDWFKEIA